MSASPKRQLIGELIAAFRASGNQDGAFENLAAPIGSGSTATDLHCLNVDRERRRPHRRGAGGRGGADHGAVTGVDRPPRARRVRAPRPDPADRRRVKVEVTPAFYARAEQIWGPLAADWAAASSASTAERLDGSTSSCAPQRGHPGDTWTACGKCDDRLVATQQEKGEALRDSHQGDPFVIPNPWDAGTAKVLAGLGFKALATTSGGFAFTLGRSDGAVTLDEVAAHVAAVERGHRPAGAGGPRERLRPGAPGCRSGDHPRGRRGPWAARSRS